MTRPLSVGSLYLKTCLWRSRLLSPLSLTCQSKNSIGYYRYSSNTRQNNCFWLLSTNTYILKRTRTSFDNVLYQQHRCISAETFKSYYSPDFPPVALAHKYLDIVHDTTHLPWWASILIATIALRTVITFPISVYAQWNAAKLRNTMIELQDINGRLKAEVASAMKEFNWDKKTANFWYRQNMRRLTKELYIKNNCHPFKSTLVFWVQLPIWIGMSLALRNMTGTTPFHSLPFLEAMRPELAHEGLLWFTNLIMPDPLLLLPIICGTVNLMNVEMSSLGQQKQTKFQTVVTNVYRGVSVIVIPIGMIMPSCMVYYWTCSSLFGLYQNLLMRHPKVKEVLRIPKLADESAHPYQDLWQLAKKRYSKPFSRKQNNEKDE